MCHIPPPISTIIFGKMYDYKAPPSLQTFNSAFCFQKPSTYILPLACQTNSCVIHHISADQSFIAQQPYENSVPYAGHQPMSNSTVFLGPYDAPLFFR